MKKLVSPLAFACALMLSLFCADARAFDVIQTPEIQQDRSEPGVLAYNVTFGVHSAPYDQQRLVAEFVRAYYKANGNDVWLAWEPVPGKGNMRRLIVENATTSYLHGFVRDGGSSNNQVFHLFTQTAPNGQQAAEYVTALQTMLRGYDHVPGKDLSMVKIIDSTVARTQLVAKYEDEVANVEPRGTLK